MSRNLGSIIVIVLEGVLTCSDRLFAIQILAPGIRLRESHFVLKFRHYTASMGGTRKRARTSFGADLNDAGNAIEGPLTATITP
jgi:hypothetical protein